MVGEEAPPWLAGLLEPLLQAHRQEMAQVLGTAQGVAAGRNLAVAQTGAAAAVVGSMPPCNLGKDKIKRFKKWSDWLKDAENKMRFLHMEDGDKKLNFLRSIAGPELTEFWDKEARIRFVAEEVAGEQVPAHTYGQVVAETKKTLLKLVSRDRAIIDLLRLEQGSRSFMEFLSEVEDQTYLCQAEERLTGEDLKRISILAGLKDRTLAEKALAEEYTLKSIIQAAVNRESSKANAEGLRARTDTVNRVEEGKERHKGGKREARINHLQAELKELDPELEVRKVRQSGKYSSRHKKGETEDEEECPKCTYDKHLEGTRCPAERRTCNQCGEIGHFAYSKMCTRATKARKIKRVEEESSSYSEDSEEEERRYEVNRIRVRQATQWPGTDPSARWRSVRSIKATSKESSSEESEESEEEQYMGPVIPTESNKNGQQPSAVKQEQGLTLLKSAQGLGQLEAAQRLAQLEADLKKQQEAVQGLKQQLVAVQGLSQLETVQTLKQQQKADQGLKQQLVAVKEQQLLEQHKAMEQQQLDQRKALEQQQLEQRKALEQQQLKQHRKEQVHDACMHCTYNHGYKVKCPASNKECYACGTTGHLVRSQLCPKNKRRATEGEGKQKQEHMSDGRGYKIVKSKQRSYAEVLKEAPGPQQLKQRKVQGQHLPAYLLVQHKAMEQQQLEQRKALEQQQLGQQEALEQQQLEQRRKQQQDGDQG